MKINEFGEKAGRAIRENVAHIIFAAVLVLMILLSFVSVTAENGVFDWFNFAVNLSLQLALFIPYRWRQKRLSGQAEPYKQNKKLYGEKVEEIYKENEFKQFTEFCELKTKELRRQKQLSIIHSAGIDTAVYDGYISGKLTAEERAKFTPKQIKAINMAVKAKVRPVNPLCITSNSSRVKGYGVDFNDDAEDWKSVAGKVLPMLLWAAVLTYIALDSIGGGLHAVVMIVFRIVICLSAMFTGIMSGDGFVIKKDKVILCRIGFIHLFREWIQNKNLNLNSKTENAAETETILEHTPPDLTDDEPYEQPNVTAQSNI